MIALRPARPDDAAAIAAIYAPHVREGAVSFENEAPDVATMAGRMAASAGALPWIVAEEAGTPLGYAYAGAFSDRAAYRWTVETTIYLDRAACGRGVGRRLYAALLATLAAQGYRRAIGRIALPNPASVALHEALGFGEAGVLAGAGWKDGRWIDVAYWQRPLGDGAGPPAAPLPFTATGVRDSRAAPAASGSPPP